MALDYQYGTVPNLDYSTLAEIYERAVSTYADRPLWGVKRGDRYEWMTYGEFGEQVERCRALLDDVGVGKDDTVAVISDNRPEWAVGAYATYTLGARWCPMYEAQSEKDWAYIIDDSGANVVFVANHSLRMRLLTMRDQGDIDVDTIIHFDGPDEGRFDTLLDAHEPRVDAVEVDGDDICGLIYTSGTTGKPKGVLLSHHNIASNVEAIHSFDLIAPDDVSLSFLPWAHSFGQTAELHGMFAIGASVALVESISKLTDNLQEVRPTLLFSVPRIFHKLYDGVHAKLEDESALRRGLFDKALQNSERMRRQRQQNGEASTLTKLLDKFYDRVVFSKVRERFGGRLKYAISGGAKLNPEIAYFIDNLHIMVCEGYGLTETSPLVSVNLPDARKIGSVGRPVPDVEVRIEPIEGRQEGCGEVCVRGPNVMQGYFNKPEETQKAIDPDGFFHTGDLGYIDDDGFLWIEGRAKEEYKLSNGKYVAPGPLEEQLKLAPHIDQAMVEGQDQPFNIAIVNVDHDALVRWAEKQGLSTDDLLDQREIEELIKGEVDEQSEGFKAYEKPRELIIVDDEWTPENGALTPTLKLKRRVIHDMYEERIDAIFNHSVDEV